MVKRKISEISSSEDAYEFYQTRKHQTDKPLLKQLLELETNELSDLESQVYEKRRKLDKIKEAIEEENVGLIREKELKNFFHICNTPSYSYILLDNENFCHTHAAITGSEPQNTEGESAETINTISKVLHHYETKVCRVNLVYNLKANVTLQQLLRSDYTFDDIKNDGIKDCTIVSKPFLNSKFDSLKVQNAEECTVIEKHTQRWIDKQLQSVTPTSYGLAIKLMKPLMNNKYKVIATYTVEDLFMIRFSHDSIYEQ